MEICIKWSICRTCTGDSSSQLQPIFNDTRLADQLLEYAGLVVKPQDGLPDQICAECVKNLQMVHTFLTSCKRVDAHLKNAVRRTMSPRKCFPNVDSLDVDTKKTNQIKQIKTETAIHDRSQSIFVKKQNKILNLQKSLFITDQEELVSTNIVIQQEDSNSLLEDLEFVSTSQCSEHSSSSTTDKNNKDDSKSGTLENDDSEYIITDVANEVAEDDNDVKKIFIEPDNYEAEASDIETASNKGNTKHFFVKSKSDTKLAFASAPLTVDLTACAPSNFPNYNCSMCGNAFPNLTQLKSHMRSHCNEKSFECELCFKRFNAACNLTTHMRTHTGEKPYPCVHCGRRFADRSTHRKHERMHTNERPYACEICGKTFSLSTTLKAHALSHSTEKPHKCVTCNKGFRLPHQLKAHEKTHVHRYEVDFLLYN